MKLFPNQRAYENAHIGLWILKDFCWCCGFHILGMTMIVPTLIVAFDILRRHWADIHERYHNFTICMWIAANATWMTGEFFFDDGFRIYAKGFFILGILAIAYYYAFLFRKLQPEVVASLAKPQAMTLQELNEWNETRNNLH